MIARGTSPGFSCAPTFDLDWCEDDTKPGTIGECHVSSLPIVRSPAVEKAAWDEATAAVEAYFANFDWAERTAVLRLMRDIEVEPPRSRTRTLDLDWLKQPGASVAIRQEWHERLAK